ncbi:MAG: hypothetical protein HY329_00725 [Chloroflexi bacterium]|nr:hypothetical protein [Chloroflexota bacterium]
MPMRVDLDRIDRAKAAWLESEQGKSVPHLVLEMVALLRCSDLTAALDRIRVPLLVLSPASSPFVSADLASDLQRRVARAEIQYVEGARHAVIFSHAEQCARATVEFLVQDQAAFSGRGICS